MWRTRKLISMIALGAGISFALAAVFLWPRDVVELHFDTYQEAIVSGALEKEWIPGFLPKSAKNIRSISNLDSNTGLVEFDFDSDFDEFIVAQQTATPKSASSLGISNRSENFSDPRKLIYIPRILLSGEPYPGVLLVNRPRRTALYIE